MVTNELFDYLKHKSITDIQNSLNHKYDISYGSTYSIQEIRKAIQDKQPTFVNLKKKIYLVVGENPDSLVIHDGKKMIVVSDSDLKKAWTGDAVLVSEKRPEKNCENFVIFTPERDLWPDEWMESKCKANSILSTLRLGECWLPPHPVIVSYAQPTGKDIDEHKRAMIQGAEITIYDPIDPVSAFFHELGHLFWDTSVLDSEKMEFAKYTDGIGRSAIFHDDFSHDNPAECFATIYLWFAKGKALHDGYFKILDYQEPKGHKLLCDIIARIHDEKQAAKEWPESEKKVAVYFDEPKILQVIGGGVVKARIGHVKAPDGVSIPKALYSEIETIDNDRTLVSINSGLLMGKQFILKGNKIDFEYMEKTNDVPLMKAESSLTVYCDMDGVLVDFDGHYEDTFGESTEGKTPKELFDKIDSVSGWWDSAPWKAGGRELWDYLSDNFDNIVLLTSPADSVKTCREDKLSWVRREIGDGIKVIFAHNKAKFANKKSILIDDYGKQAQAFSQAGGHAIKHDNTDDTIEDMEKILAQSEELTKARERKKLKKLLFDARKNVETSPSDAQKESGNYRKGHLSWNGFDIAIETPKGSYRTGTDKKGNQWKSKLHYDYGYIKRTQGNDGDHVDVFVNGDSPDTTNIYVINQIDPDTKQFDEHKIMIGFPDKESAEDGYLKNYENGWGGLGGISELSVDEFKEWLDNGNLEEPVDVLEKAGQKNLAKLIKKNIVNKRGHRQIVYVKPIEQAKGDEQRTDKESVIHSPAFINWFGDWRKGEGSRVVNKSGKPQENYNIAPIAVYHGTSKGGFSKFDKRYLDREALYGRGFYFTEDKEIAEEYQIKGRERELLVTREEFKNKIKEAADTAYSKGVIKESDKGAYERLAEKFPNVEGGAFSKLVLEGGLKLEELVGYKSHPQVYEVFLNIRKPFNIDDDFIDIKMMRDHNRVFSIIDQSKKELTDSKLKSVQPAIISLRKEILNKVVDGKIKYKDLAQYFGFSENEINDNLSEMGYDGLTHIGGKPQRTIAGILGKHHRVWIAFEPNQIKSTQAKEFDSGSSDIYKAFLGHKDIAKLVKKQITDKRGRRQTVYVKPDGRGAAVEGGHPGGLKQMLQKMPRDAVYRLLYNVVNDKNHKWHGNQKVIKVLAEHLKKQGTISDSGYAVIQNIGHSTPDSIQKQLWNIRPGGAGSTLGDKIVRHIVSSYIDETKRSGIRKAIDFIKFNLLLGIDKL